jgi:hypothetical protein
VDDAQAEIQHGDPVAAGLHGDPARWGGDLDLTHRERHGRASRPGPSGVGIEDHKRVAGSRVRGLPGIGDHHQAEITSRGAGGLAAGGEPDDDAALEQARG